MVKFLTKSESRGDKLLKLTQFASPNFINLLILYGVWVRCNVDISKATGLRSPFIEKSMLSKIQKLYL